MARPRKTLTSSPPEIHRAVLYARVSTVEQREEGYSVEAQVRLLREYCERKGLEVAEIYHEAETAKRAGRTEFGRMLREAKRSGATAIVVEKTDRLYRNLPDRVKVAELGLDVHLVKEGEVIGPGSTSHSKFVHDIKLVVAKNYVDNLSDETRKGMTEKARQGLWPSYAPMGYRNAGEGSRKVIVPDEALAPWIRRAFEMYGRGDVSLADVARVLAAAGAKRTRKGIGPSGLHVVLTNPIYKGVIRWAGQEYPGRHEPIVDPVTWDRCQLVLAGRNPNEAGSVSRTKGDYVYKGLIRCGVCGCMATPYTAKGRYVYYACSGAKGCRRLGVREETITETVAAALDGLRIRPSVLDLLREALRSGHAERAREADSIRERAAAVVREKRELLETIYLDRLSNSVPEPIYAGLRDRVQRELAEAESLFQSAERAERTSWEQDAQLIAAVSASAERFRLAPNDLKREMARGALSNLLLKGNEVSAELRSEFRMVLEANVEAGLSVALEAQLLNWLPTVDSNHD